MDSAFIHILDPLIQQVCALKLADFAEHEEDDEYQTLNGHVHPDLNPNPPMLLVSIHQFPFCSYFNSFIFHSPSHCMIVTQKDVEDRRPVDAMDIDRYPSDVKEVPDAEDDELEEAPSERDTDAENNGETPRTSHYSDDDVPICQTPLEERISTPCDLGVSPLRAKLFDFATPSQARNRHPHLNKDEGAHEHDVDEERDDDVEDYDNEDQDEDAEDVNVVLESSHSDRDTNQPPQPVPHGLLRPTTSNVVPNGAMDTQRSPIRPTTSDVVPSGAVDTPRSPLRPTTSDVVPSGAVHTPQRMT